MSDRKAWNSRLRPVAKRKMGQKKPAPRRRPSLDEVKERFGVVTAAMLGEPKRKGPREGWYEWALREVWPVSDRKCCVCGSPVSDPAPINFSHLLERGSYKGYAKDARNVVLKCGGCHAEWHRSKARIIASKPRSWAKVVERYLELRAEANGMK